MLADFEQRIKTKAIGITNVAISKIPCTRIFYGRIEYDRKIQMLHKYLLKEAQKLNKETHVKALNHLKKADKCKQRILNNYVGKMKVAKVIEKEQIYNKVLKDDRLTDEDKTSIILMDNDLMEVGILVDIPNISNISIGQEGSDYWLIKGKLPRRVRMQDNPKALQTMETYERNRLLFMHNHPSGATFSGEDLRMFWTNDSIHTLTAVGNNGCIYLLQKGINFDKYKLSEDYHKIADANKDKLNNGTIAVQQILDNAEKYDMLYKKGREKK